MRVKNREQENKELCIEVSDMSKYYGELKAVDEITFEVEQGIIFGMLGPNGAGKTTTIEMLIGLKERTSGEVSVLGMDPERELEKLKQRVGVQLQSPSLFPRLTVEEMVDLFASFYDNPFSEEKAISMVGLEDKIKTRIESLSGGQHHRLAVALALLSNGDIIFLDEPTTGLDPQARRGLWDVIEEMKEMGKTVFLTTHYMEEAEELCDDLLIIDHGEIIARGGPEELIERYFQERTIEFTDPGFREEGLEKLSSLEHVTHLEMGEAGENDNLIYLYTDNAARTMNELMNFSEKNGDRIENLNLRHPTLEDLFLKLTGRKIRE